LSGIEIMVDKDAHALAMSRRHDSVVSLDTTHYLLQNIVVVRQK